MTDSDLRTVSVLEGLRRRRKTWNTWIYPRHRKYPLEYPRRVRSKSLVISRAYEKYPQYPKNPRGVWDAYGSAHIHKETLNFTLLIYICLSKPNPRNPERREDFEDIEDIFGKPSNHAVFRALGFEDILGMSSGDEDDPHIPRVIPCWRT